MNSNDIDSVVEYLRCSSCKRYLMWPPIMQKPQGENLCGRCAETASDEVLIRQMTLEQVLQKMSFPCKNKQIHGCKRRLRFGHTSQHEVKCVYNTTLCPATDCAASGSLINLPEHLSQKHAGIMKEDFKFDIEIARDYKEIIAATIKGVTYIMRYEYNAKERILIFDIKGVCLRETTYKLYLRNTALPECCVSLPTGSIPSYFLNCPMVSINMNKYLTALEIPQVVTFIFAIKTSKDDKQTQTDEIMPVITKRQLHLVVH